MSHLGVRWPEMSISAPVLWRLPDSRKAVAAESGSVLRSLYLVLWKIARRVV